MEPGKEIPRVKLQTISALGYNNVWKHAGLKKSRPDGDDNDDDDDKP